MNKCQKEKNRFFVVLIMVFAITFLIFRGTVLAATVYTEGDFYYELQGEAILITGYFGTDTEITLPDKIAGYPVSKIAKGAFIDTDTVTAINLPDTIMEIEEGAIAKEIKVVYMSDADTSKQLEPDDSAEREETGKDDGMKTDEEMNGEDNKETAMEETTGNDASVAGNVEEVEINPLDMVEEENNEENNKDNSKGIKTDDDEYTIRVDENHHLVIEDSDGNKQVIDDKNEYTMTTDQNGTVTIQNQDGEKVFVDSDGTIKAEENTIAKIEKDGTVKNVSPKNAIWVVIIAILVVPGIICVAAVIVRKKKRIGK